MNKILALFIALFAAITTYAAATAVDSTFTIQGSKGKLAAHLQLPQLKKGQKVPVVIICHGFTGNQNEKFLTLIANNVVERGMAALRFDFNGHGQSEGLFQDMTPLNEIEDLKRVIEWTQAQSFTRHISLAGHSLGGLVVGLVAPELTQRKIHSLVLMAPAAVARDNALMGNLFGTQFDPWNMPDYVTLWGERKLCKEFFECLLRLPIYEKASQYKGKTLVVHGTRDRAVPYSNGEVYAQVMPKASLYLIEGDDHLFTQSLEPTALKIADWLNENK